MGLDSETTIPENAPRAASLKLHETLSGEIQLQAGESLSPKPERAAGGYRIALLTPYTGGNLGDAAIVDSAIRQLRMRIAGAHFSGITLNCENFVERHGDMAFPLSGSVRPYYTMAARPSSDLSAQKRATVSRRGWFLRMTSRLVRKIPGLTGALKASRKQAEVIKSELLHSVRGYRFLRQHDLLIVTGGGQLDEEWGGPWGHPFALFKWSAIARLAGVRCEFLGVGASKVDSRLSRMFLSMALRMSQGRSYRDQYSKSIAAGLFHGAAGDSVVPDIAFSSATDDLHAPGAVRPAAKDRRTIAISPICYCRPGSWPREDSALYRRYLQQMSQMMEQLIERGYSLVMICSSLSDVNVIREIIHVLSERPQPIPQSQLYVPSISTWRDLSTVLRSVDFVIASRLHSAILSFVANKPTIAISFDKKVDRVMQDLGQTDYLLQIRDFDVEDVISAFPKLEENRNAVIERIAAYTQQARQALDTQFDLIAQRVMAIQPLAG